MDALMCSRFCASFPVTPSKRSYSARESWRRTDRPEASQRRPLLTATCPPTEEGRGAAHKLARLIYAMLTKGEEYTDAGQDYFEERYRERVLRNLTERAKKLGMQNVPAPQPV